MVIPEKAGLFLSWTGFVTLTFTQENNKDVGRD